MLLSKRIRILSGIVASAIMLSSATFGFGVSATDSAEDDARIATEGMVSDQVDLGETSETDSIVLVNTDDEEENNGIESSSGKEHEAQEGQLAEQSVVIAPFAALEGSTYVSDMGPNTVVEEVNFNSLTGAIMETTDLGSAFTFVSNGNDRIFRFGSTIDISIDGVNFTRFIDTGGRGFSAGRLVKFTVPDGITNARLTVYGTGKTNSDSPGGITGIDLRNSADSNTDGKVVSGDMLYFTKAGIPSNANIEKLVYPINEAGTYSLWPINDTVNYVFMRLEYTTDERPAWDSVSAPSVTGVNYNIITSTNSTVDVSWTGDISFAGADAITAYLLDEYGGEVSSAFKTTTGMTAGTFTLPIPTSGIYSVKVVASRYGEEEAIESATTPQEKIILPLQAPAILNTDVRNAASGNVVVKWSKVYEVESYILEYKLSSDTEWIALPANDADDREHEFVGLTEGAMYDFRVTACRGDETGVSPVKSTEVKNTYRVWKYNGVGKGGSYAGNLIEVFKGDTSAGKITGNGTAKWTEGTTSSTGELVTVFPDKINMQPDEGTKYTDGHNGFTYFFTEIDPKRENWTMEATFTVNQRTKVEKDSSGKDVEINLDPDTQSAFGIIAADITPELDTYPYINTAASAIGRHRYLKADGTYSTMQSAPGGIFKGGYTDPSGRSSPDGYISFLMDTNTYDPFFNDAYLSPQWDHRYKIGETYTMRLKKDNTGFHTTLVGYNYDDITSYEPNMLTLQDEDRYYVGVFVSRKLSVDITNIKFETRNPEDDPPPETRPTKYMGMNLSLDTTTTTGNTTYTASFIANANGVMHIESTDGKVIVSDINVEAGKHAKATLSLREGQNKYTAVLTPYNKEKQNALLDGYEYTNYNPETGGYSKVSTNFTITHSTLAPVNKAVYISPSGVPTATGTKENPYDLKTALSYCQSGQQLVLMDGTYYLSSRITIGRGNNGGTLMAEPGAKVIFDISGSSNGGLAVSGDNWHLYGFDICNSTVVGKPLLVSGNNNRIERIRVYDNVDTGISINGSSNEDQSLWPKNNLVISCEVWNSCDIALNNADGFTAKITVGSGNAFKYCISHHNIDDGWDLFAQASAGPIGDVLVENCVAYSNGTTTDDLITKGEGNGFKLGGSSIVGRHLLKNSVSFMNRNNGVTSNSGAGVRVHNTTTYKNNGSGVRLYTNNTDTSIKYQAINNVSLGNSADALSNVDPDYNSNNLWNGDGVSTSWFQTLDFGFDENINIPTHNEDGSINMNGFLMPTEAMPEETGADLTAPINPADKRTITLNPPPSPTSSSSTVPAIGGGGGAVSGASAGESVKAKSAAQTVTKTSAVAAADKAINAAIAKAEQDGKSTTGLNINIKYKNVDKIEHEAFKAIVDAANESGGKVKLIVDSMSADGKKVDVRITVDPTKAASDLNLAASTNNETAKKIKSKFEKHFSNVSTVINMKQSGEFGMSVRVAAKLGSTVSTPYFYLYDTKTNKYKRLTKTNYKLDKNGYVHFDASVGGNIIVTDGAMKK